MTTYVRSHAVVLMALGFSSFQSMAISTPAAETASSRLEKIQRSGTSENKDFQVSLHQELVRPMRKKSDVSTGTLEFSPPRSFRWEMKSQASSPRTEIYVSDGKVLWKYNSATKHAAKLSANLKELEFVDAILNPKSLAERYEVKDWTSTSVEKLPQQSANKEFFELTPKNNPTDHTLFVSIDKKNARVDELRFVYQNGNKAKLKFEEYKVAKLAKERFEFTPPPGAVVDK